MFGFGQGRDRCGPNELNPLNKTKHLIWKKIKGDIKNASTKVKIKYFQSHSQQIYNRAMENVDLRENWECVWGGEAASRIKGK